MSTNGITLTRHLLMQQKSAVPAADLALMMEQVTLAAKRISNELARAALTGILGYTGATNVQGEKVKKLDSFGNQVFMEVFGHSFPVCTLISEEMDEPQHFTDNCRERSYAICFDPIDGSSNTDVDGSLGTIFGIRKRGADHSSKSVADLLAAGTTQVAAGYALYGPSTILVVTWGSGVNAYALDREIGEFILFREGVRMPERGATYAVNEAHYERWHRGAQKLIDQLRAQKTGGYSLRYAGAFAADFHRALIDGGIYLYPSETTPGGKPGGKLRLMYEVAPLSMVAEQAGGRSTTGKGRALELVPKEIHERAPVYIGSKQEVEMAEKLGVES